jgi:hypothetical protein
MTVRELVKELERYNPESKVFVVDGHHFMRKHQLVRVDDEPSQEYATPGKVLLVGSEAPKR